MIDSGLTAAAPDSRPVPHDPRLLQRWFIDYNPLYFASAMLILGGLFLLAQEIDRGDTLSHACIAGIAQLYTFALIGAAWLLLRHTTERRPAVILGLAALIFIFDPAFCSERLAPGLLLSLTAALLGPIKLALLARVFRIRGALAPLVVTSAALAAVPLMPHAIETAAGFDTIREPLHLVFTWSGAGLLAWALFRGPSVFWSELISDDWSALVAGRIARILPFLITALFLSHAAAWSLYLAVPFTAAHAAPYVLAAGTALAVRFARAACPAAAELAAWAAAGGALIVTSGDPWAAAAMAFLSASALSALVRAHNLRLVLPAMFCLFAGAVIPTMSPPAPAAYAAFALALLGGAFSRRHLECLVASAGAFAMACAPFVTPPIAAIAAVVWFAPWAWLLFAAHRRWLTLASILALQGLAAWQRTQWPELASFCAAVSIIPIAAGLMLRQREWIAAGAAGILAVAQFTGGWGVALVVAGFAALAAGIAVNLAARRVTAPDGGITLRA